MYYLTESKTKVDNKWYVTYGIGCGERTIHDLTTDKTRAQHFVDLLNFHKLDPIHMTDAVLDFIG